MTDLLFVGRASAKTLASCGIRTIGDLARTPRENLVRLLGKNGGQLHDYAAGTEHSPVRPAGSTPPPKSVGNGLTFRRNLVGEEEIRAGVQMLAQRVAARLRRHEMKCTTVQVSIRSPEFKTVSRQKKTDAPTNVSREIHRCAMELIAGCWNWSAPVRAITITAASLLPEEEAGDQLDLFAPQASEKREKQEKLERAMDQLRERYGTSVVRYASNGTPAARAITGDDGGEREEEEQL